MLVPSRFLNSATLYGAGRQVGFEDFMGSNYPLVNIQKTIENGPFILDLPIKKGFSIVHRNCDFTWLVYSALR